MFQQSQQCGILAWLLLASSAWQIFASDDPKAAQKTAADAPAITISQKKASTDAEIQKTLLKPVEANLAKLPLKHVVERIEKAIGENVWIDEQALREEGVLLNVPISHKGQPIAAARLLDRILEPLGLTWIVEDHVIKVTTIIAAEEKLITRTYPVDDLIEYGLTHRSEEVAFSETGDLEFVQFGGCPCGEPADDSSEGWLIELIQAMSVGVGWNNVEGTGFGTISHLNNSIVIRTTRRLHVRCASVIDTVRRFTRRGLNEGGVSIRPAYYPTEEDTQVKKALEKVVSLKCKELPLDQLLEQLSQRLDVPIAADEHALKEEGVSIDEPLSLDVNDVPVGSLLNLALEPLGLTGIVEDGRVLVTTIMAAEERSFAKFHDIQDLCESGFSGEKLTNLLYLETSGPWLDVDGTGGLILQPLDGLLAVRNTHRVHVQVEAILTDFRKLVAEGKAKPKAEPEDPKAVTMKFYAVPNAADLDAVRKAISTLIEPDTWSENNDKAEGKLLLIDRLLVVKNRNDVHAKVKKFLDDLEKSGFELERELGEGTGAFRAPLSK